MHTFNGTGTAYRGFRATDEAGVYHATAWVDAREDGRSQGARLGQHGPVNGRHAPVNRHSAVNLTEAAPP
jgi:hypothetical protein